MSGERRLEVLRAIIEDYVETREPIGSRALVERHALGVSPATVRNDMAALEDAGYIAQPHTSAGRIPTDLGYRLFVDRLHTIKPMSVPERRAISTFLESAVDLDDVVSRTVRLLAQLTGQVAVVQYPSLRRSTIRHVELVLNGADRLLVILITDTGRVEQRTLQIDAASESDMELTEEAVAELRGIINAVTEGRRLNDLDTSLADRSDQLTPHQRELVGRILTVVKETLALDSEERIVLGGTANLARSDVDFPQTISPVLEALEEQVVLLHLLAEHACDEESDAEVTDSSPSDRIHESSVVSVRIGRENEHSGLTEASVVTAGYGSGVDLVARLGILGPTRMDYPVAISSVRAVARYLSRILTT